MANPEQHNQDPFVLLQDSAAQFQAAAAELPAQATEADVWRGIGFRLFGRTYIAPFTQVDEIMYNPNCTKVPGVKGWVNGIANVRGRLMTVVDLGAFFEGRPSLSSRSARVLAIKEGDLYTGAVVEEVLGMHSFAHNEFETDIEEPSEHMRPFVKGCFRQEDREWVVVDLFSLAQAPSFLEVAV